MAKTRKRVRKAPERPSGGAARGIPFPKGNALGLATRFQPGKTGNPGGIPKDVRQFRDLMRMRTAAMLERIDDLLDHGTEEGVVKAIREINANAWPRPTQIELGGPDGGPIAVKAVLTSDEKRARAAALLAKAGAVVAPEDEPDDADD